MNSMTLKRFKNELIILLTLLFTLFALGYKFSAQNYVQKEQQRITQEINDMTKVAELKKLWDNKSINNEADKFKTIVANDKIKSFEKRSKKVIVGYENLSVSELNSITKQLFKTALQITKLDIKESGKEKYTMEFTCKW